MFFSVHSSVYPFLARVESKSSYILLPLAVIWRKVRKEGLVHLKAKKLRIYPSIPLVDQRDYVRSTSERESCEVVLCAAGVGI